MEKQIVGGSIGDVKVAVSGGKVQLIEEMDLNGLADLLFDKIEEASAAIPGAKAVEEGVKLAVKASIAALG